MKRLLFILLMISLFGCGLGRGGGRHGWPAPKGPLTSYRFQKSNGRMMYPLKYIDVNTLEDGSVQMEWSNASDEILVLQLSPAVLEQVGKLVDEHNLKHLKEKYYPRALVHDGIMWSVRFGFGEVRLNTDADNMWPPKKQKEGIDAINAYLDSLAQAPDAVVIGKKSHQDR